MALSTEAFAEQALAILAPLPRHFESVNNAIALFQRLGYDPGASAFANVLADLQTLGNGVENLIERFVELRDDPETAALDYLGLATELLPVFESLRGLPDDLATLTLPPTFVPDLLNLLLADALYAAHPVVYRSLILLGVIRFERIAQGTGGAAIDFDKLTFDWNRLGQVFSDPGAWAEEVYGWGTAEFQPGLLLARFSAVIDDFGSFTRVVGMTPAQIATFYPSAVGAASRPVALKFPIYEGSLTPGVRFGVGLVGMPVEGKQAPVETDIGIGLMPYAEGAAEGVLPLPADFELAFSGSASVAGGVVLAVRPHSGVELKAGVEGNVAVNIGDLSLQLRKRGENGGPLILFGSPDETRLEAAALLVEVGVTSGSFHVATGAEGMKLVVDVSNDALLSQLLSEPIEIDAKELIVAWGPEEGVSFRGGATLSFVIHVNKTLGPLFVDDIGISLGVKAEGLTLGATVSGGLAIGPLVAAVSKVGFNVVLEFGKPGLLGQSDIAFKFKPPSGIGLSLDASAVKLGGFLSFEPEEGRYIGALELSILDLFDVTAIGILNTKMPDGSEGFSLLVVIGFTFPVPIHIAYNFFLAGVGGILGLNRSTNIDRLRLGLQTGVADNILFPTDIVRRINVIVTDLQEVFPPTNGQFVVGPMALITWSTPPLIRLKVGLIIEFANPVRIAILGALRAQLPDEEAAALDLKVNFLGAVNFQKGMLSFDASIYDSGFGIGDFKLSLEGDIALRLSWGEQKDFVVSVGGFHPEFTAPAYLGVSHMKRIRVSLLKDNPRLSLQAYFAITTNTVQFGSRLDFYFSVSAFTIVGEMGFDVLIQFSPFRFLADVGANVSVKSGDTVLFAIELAFSLRGPTPWIASGTAKFKILCFTVQANFKTEFGDEAAETLPEFAVLPALIDDLLRDENWRAEPGDGAPELAILRREELPEGQVLVDGMGNFSVEQKILPLETDVTRYATSRVSDVRRVRVHGLTIGGSAATTRSTTDSFAPAAYQELSDRDKLRAKSFEAKPSGVATTAGTQGVADFVVAHPLEYEQIVSDREAGGAPIARGLVSEERAHFEALVPGGAIGRSAGAKARRRKQERGTLGVALHDERFAVVSRKTLQALDDEGNGVDLETTGGPALAFTSRSEAEARLERLANTHDDLQVVPEYQLVA